MSLHNLPPIQISAQWDGVPTRCPAPPPASPALPAEEAIASWLDAYPYVVRAKEPECFAGIPGILRAVRRWEATEPKTPSPLIMYGNDRVERLASLTYKWPLDKVEAAERVGYSLPEMPHVKVYHVMLGLLQRQTERRHNGNDWYNPELEEQWKMMTAEDRIRQNPELVSIVTPELQAIVRGGHMIREPGHGWWISGEKRNRYVTAGYGVLFRRDEKDIEVLIGPMPPLPEEFKTWTWKERQQWSAEQRSKIPKMTVTVVYEYGSRRHAEGDAVFDHEGNVVRRRVAGEWTREMIAMLKGTPSPFFFDDFTGHPMPFHSTKAREFRQEVADVAFVYMHQ
jgi:hypothetical protein